jgi:hypothetical protein
VRVVSRRNIFAVVVGVLLAGISYLAFNYWVEGVIDRQGEIEVGTRPGGPSRSPKRACGIPSGPSIIWPAAA